MKNIVLIILIPFLYVNLTNCSNPKKDKEKQIIESFYKAYNTKDYNKLSKIIGDNIELYEMGQLVLKSKERYMDIVEWGEVFSSKNILDSIYLSDEIWTCKETQESERISFLYNRAINSIAKYYIAEGKVVKIEIDLPNFDSDLDTQKSKEFQKWVYENHPELMAKLNMLSKEGAEKYKQAMEMYRKKQSKTP